MDIKWNNIMTDITAYIDASQLAEYRKSQRAPRQRQRFVWLDGNKLNLTEAARYQELQVEVAAGMIKFLTVKKSLVIQRKGEDGFGHMLKKRVYTPEWIYWDVTSQHWVAEEIKATRYDKRGNPKPVTNGTFGYRWDMARARYRKIEFRVILG